MIRLLSTLQLDFMVQARSQMFHAVLLLSALSAAVLLMLPEHLMTPLLVAYVIMAGLTTTNFLFSSAMMLQDRHTDTLAALRLTPLNAWEYCGSKVVTLSTMSLIEGTMLAAGGYKMAPNWPVLLLGIVLYSIVISLIAMLCAAPYKSFIKFLFPVGVTATVLVQLPALSLFSASDTMGRWILMPTSVPFNILVSAFDPQRAWPPEDWVLGGGLWSLILMVVCGLRLQDLHNWR